MFIKLKRLSITLSLLIVTFKLTLSAPKTWPYMKTYDIWETNKTLDKSIERPTSAAYNSRNNFDDNDLMGSNGVGVARNNSLKKYASRKPKVLGFFPLPIDDECLSDDARRVGMCMNVYECRIQGGTSRGDCALGFGVCCVFEMTCDQEVDNNITYFVSPKFPAIMPSDKDQCTIKIKLVSDDISQIRLDFLHFSMGQPNRMTGLCESDVFTLEGGVAPFILCGQNTGQHIFYDIGPSKARAENQELKININLNKRSVSTRLWEIRISQIPFGSRAPSGCLQYFTDTEGIIQTFNFADNGRHLANQEYRSCVRQERGKCSIIYEPCDDQSFRIGPVRGNGMPAGMNGFPGGGGSYGSNDVIPGMADAALADETLNGDGALNDENGDLTQMDPLNGDSPDGSDSADSGDTTGDDTADSQADETQQDDAQQDETQEEGSGGSDGGFFGGFSSFAIPSFFRSFTGRQSRQLYSPCVDRITMPCIVEDFIGAGMGDIPTCIPVHCGSSLCQLGVSSCRVETSVTPFHIGVHFGDGKQNKGSPEDNIGACLRYKQIPCS